MDSRAERAALNFFNGGGLGHRRGGILGGGTGPARGGTEL